MARSSIELIVDASNAITPLKRVSVETSKLENAVQGTNRSLDRAKGKFKSVGQGAKTASSGVKSLVGAVKNLAIAAAAVTAAKFIFANTAELEKQTRSLKVLTGSLDSAKGIISELQAFGALTPFTSTELIDTAKRLKAFGVETTKLVDITKRLGDVAGATGADLGGIATAFGQIQAKGKLQTEELLQLQERGVDLASVLKKECNLTGEEFSQALQKGQISAEAAEFALKKLTDVGGTYADGAISQSDTLSGKLSTLVDGVQRLATRIGEVLAPVLKDVFDLANAALARINQAIAAGSITDQTKQGFKKTAEDLVSQQAGFLPGGAFGAGQVTIRSTDQFPGVSREFTGSASSVVSQITNELINQEVARLAAGNTPALPDSPMTLPPLRTPKDKPTGGGGSTKTLREQQDISLKMNELLMKQQQIRFSTNEIAKSQVERDIRILELKEGQLMPMEKARAIEKARNDNLENIANIMRGKIKLAAENNKVNLDGMKAVFEEGKIIDTQLEKQAEKMKSLYKSIGDTISSGIVDSLTAAVEGTKSLAEVASDTLRSLSKILLQFGVQSLLGGLGGGNPGSIFTKLFGGGRASGGTVAGGRSFLVGERGPELFTPGRTGSIAPNSALGGANVTVNVDASGSSVEGDSDQAGQLGKMLGAAVQAELIKQKRPGGLLA